MGSPNVIIKKPKTLAGNIKFASFFIDAYDDTAGEFDSGIENILHVSWQKYSAGNDSDDLVLSYTGSKIYWALNFYDNVGYYVTVWGY